MTPAEQLAAAHPDLPIVVSAPDANGFPRRFVALRPTRDNSGALCAWYLEARAHEGPRFYNIYSRDVPPDEGEDFCAFSADVGEFSPAIAIERDDAWEALRALDWPRGLEAAIRLVSGRAGTTS